MEALVSTRSKLVKLSFHSVAQLMICRTGIGLSTALLLHSLGANILITDLAPPKSSVPAEIAFFKLDVTDYKQLLASFHYCKERFGSFPDAVFANAGIAEKGRMFGGKETEDDITQEPDHAVVKVDGIAVLNTVRIAWWGIRQNRREGSIIVTASMAGYAGQAGLPA